MTRSQSGSMRFELKPSFVRQFEKLKTRSPSRADAARDVVRELSEKLSHNQPLPLGLGLKKLRKNHWEVRSSLSDRAVFFWKGDLISWILIGNHNDVRNFLKSI